MLNGIDNSQKLMCAIEYGHYIKMEKIEVNHLNNSGNSSQKITVKSYGPIYTLNKSLRLVKVLKYCKLLNMDMK